MTQTILHADMNSFYASVEIMLNPSLRGKAVAVCGSVEDRHGIVLAKSDKAKKAGVGTGMTNWEAKKKCPDLICVPPQYDQYVKYSKLARAIYERYTDQVEPYGLDECFLGITGSLGIFGDGLTVAEEIRRTTREELGLTVSIGVSFNKVFAKLGSDMKKPDAITVISTDNFKEKVWTLPVGELLYVGPATKAKLARYSITTIGDLAQADPVFLKKLLGVGGTALWHFANGTDTSRVMPTDYHSTMKSVGHGITCTSDLETFEEVSKVFLYLAQDIGHKLRVNELCAGGVQITVRDNGLSFKRYQARLTTPTQSPAEIAALAKQLFQSNYTWQTPARAVTVCATNLMPKSIPQQINLFDDIQKRQRQDKLEVAVEGLRGRFGKWAVCPATLLSGLKVPMDGRDKVVLPGMMYQ